MATRVYLLDNGTLELDEIFMTWNHGHGSIRFPVYAILIDHPDAKILLDTGFTKEWVDRKLPFEKPQQSEEQTIPAQLAKVGLTPEDIDIVVNSHLHFDHCCGNMLFPHAKFVMSKSELRHAFVPDPWERLGYDRDLVDMPGANVELLDLNGGDWEVVRGLTLFHTPGHSSGHLSAMITMGSQAPMIFPIDVCWLKKNLEQKVLMGLHSDPLELLDSMMRIQNLALRTGGTIFYPHDPAEYETYKKAPDFYEG